MTAPIDRMLRWRAWEGPLGRLRLVAQGDRLVGLWFDEHRPAPREDGWVFDPAVAVLDEAARQLDDWLAGRRKRFELPLAEHGTAFQHAVRAELARIPYGETIAYRTLAARIGQPAAVRAVGTAVARNPLAIVVPCHRVIGADGSLAGYAGGVARKAWLLALERGEAQPPLAPARPGAIGGPAP